MPNFHISNAAPLALIQAEKKKEKKRVWWQIAYETTEHGCPRIIQTSFWELPIHFSYYSPVECRLQGIRPDPSKRVCVRCQDTPLVCQDLLKETFSGKRTYCFRWNRHFRVICRKLFADHDYFATLDWYLLVSDRTLLVTLRCLSVKCLRPFGVQFESSFKIGFCYSIIVGGFAVTASLLSFRCYRRFSANLRKAFGLSRVTTSTKISFNNELLYYVTTSLWSSITR